MPLGLLVYPALLLGIGLVLLALERRQVVEWQTLTGAGLFAAGLVGAALVVFAPWSIRSSVLLGQPVLVSSEASEWLTRLSCPSPRHWPGSGS
jgi:hypothetical protein